MILVRCLVPPLGRRPGKARAADSRRESGNLIPGASLFFGAEDAEGGTLPVGQPRAAISWSGGKDSCAALHRTHAHYDLVCMITMFDEAAERSRSHGLRPELLAAQADRLGLRRITGRCTWDTYDAAFSGALREARDGGVTHVIFGDILFDEHRAWAENQCAAHHLVAVEPLFGWSTVALFDEWTASGADAIIVTARAECLDESWLGRPLRREMLGEFTRLGVDPCGERGEYHTLVTDSPLFTSPIDVVHGEHVLRSGCYALDLNLAQTFGSAGSGRPEGLPYP
jgi:diphthine-ammonia ligase